MIFPRHILHIEYNVSNFIFCAASDYRFGIFKLFFQQYFKYISFIGGETGVPGKIQRRVASQ
jgi:hypothetical protein